MKFAAPSSAKKSDPKPAAAPPLQAPSTGKKEIFAGFFLLAASFVMAAAVIYLLVNAQASYQKDVAGLKKKVSVLHTEKDVAERKAAALAEVAGKTLYLEKIIAEARRTYGETEEVRKEGSLWIDRRNANFIVTLGALNGITENSVLSVYADDVKFATVKVVTPLDVVSYVQPVDKKLIQFTHDYYRVVVE